MNAMSTINRSMLILLSFLVLCIGCNDNSVRQSTTYKLWTDKELLKDNRVVELRSVSEADLRMLAAQNEGRIWESSEGKWYYECRNSYYRPPGTKLLMTPLTVTVDGVVLAIIGVSMTGAGVRIQ